GVCLAVPHRQPQLKAKYWCHSLRNGPRNGASSFPMLTSPLPTPTPQITVLLRETWSIFQKQSPLNTATLTASTAATVHAHLAHFLKRRRRIPTVYPPPRASQ